MIKHPRSYSSSSVWLLSYPQPHRRSPSFSVFSTFCWSSWIWAAPPRFWLFTLCFWFCSINLCGTWFLPGCPVIYDFVRTCSALSICSLPYQAIFTVTCAFGWCPWGLKTGSASPFRVNSFCTWFFPLSSVLRRIYSPTQIFTFLVEAEQSLGPLCYQWSSWNESFGFTWLYLFVWFSLNFRHFAWIKVFWLPEFGPLSGNSVPSCIFLYGKVRTGHLFQALAYQSHHLSSLKAQVLLRTIIRVLALLLHLNRLSQSFSVAFGFF